LTCYFPHSAPQVAIYYGSNFTTELRSLYQGTIRVLIVEEPDYQTGDCHGKMGANLRALLNGDRPHRAIQFRLLGANWLAKETLAHSSYCDFAPASRGAS